MHQSKIFDYDFFFTGFTKPLEPIVAVAVLTLVPPISINNTFEKVFICAPNY